MGGGNDVIDSGSASGQPSVWKASKTEDDDFGEEIVASLVVVLVVVVVVVVINGL